MKKVLPIIFYLILTSAFSQNKLDLKIYESEEYKDRIKNDTIKLIHTSPLGNTITIIDRKKEFKLDVFGGKMNKILSQSIVKEKNEIIIGNIINNNEFIFFTQAYPKRNIRIISYYTIDLETNKIQKNELFKSEIDNNLTLFSNKKDHAFAISKKSNFFTLLNYVINRGEIYFDINVFDSKTLQLIYKKQFKRNENELYHISEIKITDNKEVIIIGKSCFNTKNPLILNETEYHFHIEKFSEANYSNLKIILKDKYINAFKAKIDNRNYNLYGLYSEKKLNHTKGLYKVKINLDTFNIVSKTTDLYPDKIFEDLFTPDKITKAKENELSDFNINHILTDKEGSTYIIAEKKFLFYGVGNNNQIVPKFSDVIVIKYNKNEKLVWGKAILKRDTKASYNAYLDKNDQLKIILNSSNNPDPQKDVKLISFKGLGKPKTALYAFSFEKDNIQKIQNNNDRTYYLPKYGNYSNGKFVMPNDSNKIMRLMKLE